MYYLFFSGHMAFNALFILQWAYGVTCWEVFSLGSTPYPGVANHEMLELLFIGLRLKKPTLCPENMY